MVDVTWSGNIHSSEYRDWEGVLPHLVYLPIRVEGYHLAGAIHDPVEEECAVGGRRSEAVRVDVCIQVVLLLGGAILDLEGGGAIGGLGAVAVHVVVSSGDVVFNPGKEGGVVGEHLHGVVRVTKIINITYFATGLERDPVRLLFGFGQPI